MYKVKTTVLVTRALRASAHSKMLRSILDHFIATLLAKYFLRFPNYLFVSCKDNSSQPCKRVLCKVAVNFLRNLRTNKSQRGSQYNNLNYEGMFLKEFQVRRFGSSVDPARPSRALSTGCGERASAARVPTGCVCQMSGYTRACQHVDMNARGWSSWSPSCSEYIH